MAIEELTRFDRRALKRFITLERKLLTDFPLYVSLLDADQVRDLSGKSAACREMDIGLFIANDSGRDIARCAALINPKYQQAKKENVGFIGYFAAAPGCEAAVRCMLEQAETWLLQRGVGRVIAPYNGHPFTVFGFLTDAFDEEPVMNYGWNPPYYPTYFTQAGYYPRYPMLVYTADFSSAGYKAAKARAAEKHDIQLRPINKKRWRSEMEIFREMINETFDNEWLWYPFSLEEFCEAFQTIKPMIDPHQMVIAEVQGKPAGVVVAYPNWNPLLRKFRGKTGIIEQIKFLMGAGHYETAGTWIVAVKSEFRGRWIGPALKMAVFQRYEELGLKKAYGATVDEDNLPSRRMNEAVGAVGRMQYHVYDKMIGNK